MGLMAAGLLSLVGCASPAPKPPEHHQLLQAAETAFDAKRYTEADRKVTDFLRKTPTGKYRARAFYVRGMCNAQMGRRQQARADLLECVRMKSDLSSTWRAYTVLGTLAYEDQDWTRAADYLEAAAHRSPLDPPKDAILWRLGQSRERQGRWSAALPHYDTLLREFPRSQFASAAKRRLRLRADHFAIQVGSFAQLQNARNLQSNLARENLRTEIVSDVQDQGSRYLVLVGRYLTYEEAARALPVVQQWESRAFIWP